MLETEYDRLLFRSAVHLNLRPFNLVDTADLTMDLEVRTNPPPVGIQPH